MDFWQAIVSGFKNYVVFRGRAYRSEYWYWVLALIIGGIITAIIDYAAFGIDDTAFDAAGYGPVNRIFSVATFLPTLAIGIRRLHDIDRTGWWILIWLTVIGAILLIYWACVRGTPGPNRFGPDPFAGQT
jgi:uncharacterized membrane protein YhaH (DUF805 family)